jgi:hypothetical protein
MGTRSLTVMYDEAGNETVVMYRHWDGYPEGHGLDLANFLKGISMTNGYSGDADRSALANGMGNLNAMVVAHFSPEHDVHLYPKDTRGCWEEYVYHVKLSEDKHLIMEVDGLHDGEGEPLGTQTFRPEEFITKYGKEEE